MNTTQGLIAFFAALPACVTLLSRLGSVLNRLLNYANQRNLNAWIDLVEQAITKLEEAKTQDEKLESAKALVSIIRSLNSSH